MLNFSGGGTYQVGAEVFERQDSLSEKRTLGYATASITEEKDRYVVEFCNMLTPVGGR